MYIRSKSFITLEAVEWNGVNITEARHPKWFQEGRSKKREENGSVYTFYNDLYVRYGNDVFIANPGDFIVRLPDGNLFPVKPIIFNLLFERQSHGPNDAPPNRTNEPEAVRENGEETHQGTA